MSIFMSPLQRVRTRIAGTRTRRHPSHIALHQEIVAGSLPSKITSFCTQTSSGERPNEPNNVCQGKFFSLERCFSLADVHSFCQLCHITDPIHLDISEAQARGFSTCVLPELMYAGLFPAIIGTHFPGSVYVSQRLEFKSPVLLGDCLLAEVKAVHMRNVRDKYRYKMYLERRAEQNIQEKASSFCKDWVMQPLAKLC